MGEIFVNHVFSWENSFIKELGKGSIDPKTSVILQLLLLYWEYRSGAQRRDTQRELNQYQQSSKFSFSMKSH